MSQEPSSAADRQAATALGKTIPDRQAGRQAAVDRHVAIVDKTGKQTIDTKQYN